MEMTIQEKLRYAPKEGDVIVYLDGKNFQIKEIRKTHVLMCPSAGEVSAPWRPIAHIRTDMIENQCFLCRKRTENDLDKSSQ